MSRKFLWLLAVFMAISMLGLIIVQTYWINNAVDIKEKQFSQLVNHVISNVAGEVQQQETMLHIMDVMTPSDSNSVGEFSIYESGPESTELTHEFKLDIHSSHLRKGRMDQQVYVYQHSNLSGTSREITIISEDTMLRIKDKAALRIDTSGVEKITWVQPRMIRDRITQEMAGGRRFLDDVISRMTNPDYPVEKRVKQEVLEMILRNELNNYGIDLEYEFAVYRENLDIAYKTENYKNNETELDYFVTELFPRDVFSHTGYLSVYFPHKRSFLLKSLGFMGTSSMILTLVIILSFSFTIYIIFKQKRLSEIKNDFVNNMTHELKTPISTISLASQMLNDQSIPAESKNIGHISGVIQEESKRLGYQVEKVLQMAVFDRGRIELKLKKTDINELVQQVINNFTIQLKAKDVSVIQDLNAEKSVTDVDTVHFTNVVSNLIDNAIKYSKKDPEIRISSYNRNGKLYLKFRDNGIGIKKEDQNKIFEKFYRVPTGNIHNVKGFGLGLSYVKKIVEEHNGSISLKSELGKWAEFEICLVLNSPNK